MSDRPDTMQRIRVIEYVCDGVLLARYQVVDGQAFRADPPWPWPEGTEIHTWIAGQDTESEVFPRVSGHADTAALIEDAQERGGSMRWQAAVDALEADLLRQADRIAWLEGEVAGWRIKLAECEERHA